MTLDQIVKIQSIIDKRAIRSDTLEFLDKKRYSKSKDEWIEDPNFVYVRIDKTSQWTDVRNFMSDELSKQIKTDGRPRYKLSGKNPRVNVLQNNFNAIVLLIKGMSPKEISVAIAYSLVFKAPDILPMFNVVILCALVRSNELTDIN